MNEIAILDHQLDGHAPIIQGYTHPAFLSESDRDDDSKSFSSNSEITDLHSSEESEHIELANIRAAFAEELRQRREQEPEKKKKIASRHTDREDYDGLDSVRIIDKVRDYQQELFERAKEENVIAV